MKRYETFDLKAVARLARNYLTGMVDDANDYLPYWYVQMNSAPAYARHVRVDDAELVASWYEAAVCLRKILGGTKRSKAVEAGFKRHLLRSWGPKGLRYHADYPWSNTRHSSFHEMGYVLAGLNRLLEEEPGNKEAEKRASRLVKGLRGLVITRTTKTFWSGDYPFKEKIYEFPADLYLPKEGWVPERCTGRGDESIRNAVILQPLVLRAERGDKTALDLAEGLANHLLGMARYFNWKGEYLGHVHSTMWFAMGLVRLGRLMGNNLYIEKADSMFRYTLSLSSEFGWVPEYAQWHPMSEEHCETCCIRDMIECALELIDCGYDYWDVVDKFTRNQLSEQQVKDGCFVAVDNTREDSGGYTWKDMDKRVVGGWSGGAEANSVSLQRFRSIAGCCVGKAPQALWAVWTRVIVKDRTGITVNLPMNKSDRNAEVVIGYPNEGCLQVRARKAGEYRIRTYDWMGTRLELLKNNERQALTYNDNGCLVLPGVEVGDTIKLRHPLREEQRQETVRDQRFTVSWKGPDVVRMDPPGLPLRLYQREEGVDKVYPPPATARPQEVSMAPTQQKK